MQISTMGKIVLWGNLLFCIFGSLRVFSEEKILYFDDVIERVLMHSFQLKIRADDVGQSVGQQIQSRALPNPVASYSVENVFGNKNWHGWRSAESRYELAQLIELGGKRFYRSQLADYQFNAAEAALEEKKISLLNRVFKAFIDVAKAQEKWNLVKEQKKIAQEVFNTVSAKVAAGKVSLIQQNKAAISLSTIDIQLEHIIFDFDIAKELLANLWGCSCVDFESVDFAFYDVEMPLPLENCLVYLNDHPTLLKYGFAHLEACENVKLQKAEAIPDLTLLIGCKTDKFSGNRGMILGLALPIPVFNKNQGNIETALWLNQKMQDQYAEQKIALQTKLSTSHRKLMKAYQEVKLLESTILHAATQSFAFASEGYKEGKFEYLDMLDSERTLFDVKDRYIEALLNYHTARADIEFLVQDNL